MTFVLKPWASIIFGALGIASLAGACSDDTRYKVPAGAHAALEASEDSLTFVTGGSESDARTLRLTNTGAVVVTFTSIATTEASFMVLCASEPSAVIEPEESLECTVTFRPAAGAAMAAELVFESNAPDVVVPLFAMEVSGALVAQPVALEFTGDNPRRELVQLVNLGAAHAVVTGIFVNGDDRLSVSFAEELPWPTELQPLTLAPRGDASTADELVLEVAFAGGADLSPSELVVLGTDASDGTRVTISGRPGSEDSTACLRLEPDGLSMTTFSPARPVEAEFVATNCGTEPIEIVGVDFGQNTGVDDSEPFALTVPDGSEVGLDGALSPSLTMAPGDSTTMSVTYTAAAALETGALSFRTSPVVHPAAQLDIAGQLTTVPPCPTAVALGGVEGALERSAEVDAGRGARVILDASASHGNSPIAATTWTLVDAPIGSVTALEPYPLDNPDPALSSLVVDTVGSYEIMLDVVDEDGIDSCEPSTVFIFVGQPTLADTDIAIEVTWTNPDDPDEDDFSGSDVDLHFAKMGPGTWFDGTWDCYFANRNPFWSDENPSLEIDDTNGAGPELTTLDDPADCQWYAVGVHYWRQQFGTAFTTVRITIGGELAFEAVNVPLVDTDDWWDVARIHWPSGTVFAVTDPIQHEQPNGVVPPVTDEMVASELCGLPD